MNRRILLVGLWCLVPWPGGWTAVAAEPAKAPVVSVVRPVVREVVDSEDFTGRTTAVETVNIIPRVTGYIVEAPFREGSIVKAGDLLFRIDPRPYQARLDQARSQLALGRAQLQLAQVTLARDRQLAKVPGAISQQQLDQDEMAVREAEARLKATEAGIEIHQLNLAFTQVTAPIGGHIGRRLVGPGNLVNQDQTVLAHLVSRDPMYVMFNVDESTYLHLRQAARERKVDTKLTVSAGLTGEEGFPRQGHVDFVNNQVDPETGTITLRAVLPNRDGVLVPGLFVRVRLPLGAPYRALLVPAEAVLTEGGGGRAVYVVNAADAIEKRAVELGPMRDGQRVVRQGLRETDRVVSGRLEGLRPGMKVRPRAAEPPAPKPAPPEGAGASATPPAGGVNCPGILVEANYPGASAQLVSDALRSPLEVHLSGLENIRYLRSRCTSDGTYRLAIVFAGGVDRHRAGQRVRDRVAWATPGLPSEVRDAGVCVKQGTAGALVIVNLLSPEGRYDSLYLANYAELYVRDALARLAGVGEVGVVGSGDVALRVWLDRDRLVARNLGAGDVLDMLRREKAAGNAGPHTLPDLILKADGEGRVVRLRDVAHVEPGAGPRLSEARLDGKPVAALVVYPTGEVRPQELRAALGKTLDELRTRFPEGLDFNVRFDFTANVQTPQRPANPEYLLLDVDLPPTSSAEARLDMLERCGATVRQVPGVEHVLSLSENPFDCFGTGPCLLVRLNGEKTRKIDRGEVVREIRTRLAAVADVTVRLRDLSGPCRLPRCAYPIDLALFGPEVERVREWAQALGQRLGKDRQLTDLWVSENSAPRPQRFFNFDRRAAAALGLSMADISSTLQVALGPVHVADVHRFGRKWRVVVQSDAGAADLRRLHVRNAHGQMIPLSAMITEQTIQAPLALDFLELWPMVQITANPASGAALPDVRRRCEALAREVHQELGLSANYRLRWLDDAISR